MLSMWFPCRHRYPTLSKPLIYVSTHCQLSKYKPADTYTNTQSCHACHASWPPLHRDDIWTGSLPIFVSVTNVPFPLRLMTRSLFLCISEGPCVEGNEDRKVKRKRREISQSVCVIWPFGNLFLVAVALPPVQLWDFTLLKSDFLSYLYLASHLWDSHLLRLKYLYYQPCKDKCLSVISVESVDLRHQSVLLLQPRVPVLD